jgi:hypothetical protein
MIGRLLTMTWVRRLENIKPWCISRQLWWGHRIPAYFVEIEGQRCDMADDNMWVVGRDEDEVCFGLVWFGFGLDGLFGLVWAECGLVVGLKHQPWPCIVAWCKGESNRAGG